LGVTKEAGPKEGYILPWQKGLADGSLLVIGINLRIGLNRNWQIPGRLGKKATG